MKSVLTIAVGKEIYINMALNLAKSFLLWNKDNGIEFILVTDRLDIVKKSDISDLITTLVIDTKDYDTGFAIKLYLDKFIKTNYTLFIDCDCLIYGDLTEVFSQFKQREVSVIGINLTEGRNVGFCVDVKDILQNVGINYFPLLCGSLYYIKRGSVASDIYKFARELKPKYDSIGLVRLRNKENEEPLMAISMAKFNQNPVFDDGLIKADRMFYDKLQSNVLTGQAFLWNKLTPPIPTYSTRMDSRPLIIHFNASFAENHEYFSEILRLKFYFQKKWALRPLEIYIFLRYKFLVNFSIYFKNQFRPIYTSLFGNRKIKKSNRL